MYDFAFALALGVPLVVIGFFFGYVTGRIAEMRATRKRLSLLAKQERREP